MSGSVLLVEDEENLASLVRAYLEQEGFRVISAVTGAEALRAIETEPVRLVVLDLNLPDMDGFDVCRQIRTRSSVPVGQTPRTWPHRLLPMPVGRFTSRVLPGGASSAARTASRWAGAR